MIKFECDVCGKDCKIGYEQTLLLKGCRGRPERIHLCFDCMKELSKLAKPLLNKKTNWGDNLKEMEK